MSVRSMLFVANWKMQLSFAESVDFFQQYREELLAFGKICSHQLVLCPTFPALYPIGLLLQETSIALGAQTCSSYSSGAYTGEVSAKSLAEVGCSYCIVGHSERRVHFKESNEEVAAKVRLLVQEGIKPVVCVGERREQYESKKTFSVLKDQLAPLFSLLAQGDNQSATIYLAYEPYWSIGTGEVASAAYINEVAHFLNESCKEALPTMVPWKILYGGSVNETTLPPLVHLEGIHGFLIGGASLDFHKFKNMVSLCP